MDSFVITIDGPAGSGKTTTARALAQRLNFDLLESGAIYRYLTWRLWREGKDIKDFTTENELRRYLLALLSTLIVELTPQGTKLIYQEKELAEELRQREVEERVSLVSANPIVREMINVFLRGLVADKRVVTEGRDMGSVVFPEAKLKIYLTADIEVRAKRRYRDVNDRDFEAVLHNLTQRDTMDSQRGVAPLKKPEDAIVIDTTNLTVEEVVNMIMSLESLSRDEK
ncbi:MAG: (d)CMP kinase [Caldimicrobium sp.]|nr:(d)CMP kinase [Caldimicrobium sp.]MCX7613628.1 (d)CMP kinase [Caldimicrobium sp.]MDW8183107.1 (d)CMP kinase [Caldimicrobium sp.]